MKKIFLILFVLILLLSCSDPELKNPFDPDSDYQLDPMAGDLSIEQLTDSEVKLEWLENSTIVGNYTLKKRINSGSYQFLAELEPDVTSFFDSGLSVNDTYHYRLIGQNDEIETDPLSGSISTEFAEITNFQIDQIDLFDVALSWEHDCDYEDGYIIARQIVDSDKTVPIKGVFNQMESGKKSRDFEVIAELPSNCFQYLEEDLQLEKRYQYKIIAFSQVNESNPNITTYEHIIRKPGNIRYQRESITSILLSWEEEITGEDGFRIDRKIGSGIWYEGIGTVGENVTEWTDEDAAVGEIMQYRVVATYNDYESAPGYSVAINNFIPAPENLEYSVENFNNDQADVILTWSYDLPGIDGFRIEKNGTLLEEVIPFEETQWSDIGVPGGEFYEYRVVAIYQEQYSDYSNMVDLIVALNGMVMLETGSFVMGDHFNEGQTDELPTRTVYIDAFFISNYEVIHSEYIEFLNDFGIPSHGSYNWQELIDMDDSDCAIKHDGTEFYFEATSSVPTIECALIEVSWYGAVVYCNWKSEQAGLTPCYNLDDWSCNYSVNGFRLPTEAEWEYAARGGQEWIDNLRYSGCHNTEDLIDYAWYNENSNGHSRPVGMKLPNQIDIHDMSGNVWEWCNDFYASDYYSQSDNDNPTGPATGDERVLRGGSWLNGDTYARVANRINEPTEDTNFNYGFRVVKR